MFPQPELRQLHALLSQLCCSYTSEAQFSISPLSTSSGDNKCQVLGTGLHRAPLSLALLPCSPRLLGATLNTPIAPGELAFTALSPQQTLRPAARAKWHLESGALESLFSDHGRAEQGVFVRERSTIRTFQGLIFSKGCLLQSFLLPSEPPLKALSQSVI